MSSKKKLRLIELKAFLKSIFKAQFPVWIHFCNAALAAWMPTSYPPFVTFNWWLPHMILISSLIFSSEARTNSLLEVSPIIIGRSLSLVASPSFGSSFWISGMSRPAAQDAPMSLLKWFLPIRFATLANVFANEFDGECSIAFLYCHGVMPFWPAVAFMISLAMMSL